MTTSTSPTRCWWSAAPSSASRASCRSSRARWRRLSATEPSPSALPASQDRQLLRVAARHPRHLRVRLAHLPPALRLRADRRRRAVTPTLHDFRHSFAVRTLPDWYRAGVDVQSRLAWLSTYLGHGEPATRTPTRRRRLSCSHTPLAWSTTPRPRSRARPLFRQALAGDEPGTWGANLAYQTDQTVEDAPDASPPEHNPHPKNSTEGSINAARLTNRAPYQWKLTAVAVVSRLRLGHSRCR